MNSQSGLHQSATGVASPVGASFRDPAGYIFQEGGIYKRAVNTQGKADYDLLRSSGLYDALIERGWMVAHREEEPRDLTGVYKILVPEQIRHISYYYEWSFAQIRDAALLTLEIQRLAMAHGMTLKDASAFNVQFRGPTPVFIDTLSFEPNSPRPWVAYGQFCTHFLAPLAVMGHSSLELRALLRTSLEGIPLTLASNLLPRSTYLRPGLLLHVHLHARSVRKYADVQHRRSRYVGKDARTDPKPAIVDSLIRTITGLSLPQGKTEWIDYYGQATHYSQKAEEFKRAQITEILSDLNPTLIYDLGGNTGEYSRLATQRGIEAVCYDIDPLCVQQNYLQSKASGDGNMLPLIADLANPSPALGFGLEERLSFFDRSRPQLVMALALLHHLRITANVPFEKIAPFLAGLGERLVIEYVPREDPMANILTGNRAEIFHDYTEPQFLEIFGRYFIPERRLAIPDTCRSLHVFKSRNRQLQRIGKSGHSS